MPNINALSSKDQMSNVSKVLTVNSTLSDKTFTICNLFYTYIYMYIVIRYKITSDIFRFRLSLWSMRICLLLARLQLWLFPCVGFVIHDKFAVVPLPVAYFHTIYATHVAARAVFSEGTFKCSFNFQRLHFNVEYFYETSFWVFKYIFS